MVEGFLDNLLPQFGAYVVGSFDLVLVGDKFLFDKSPNRLDDHLLFFSEA